MIKETYERTDTQTREAERITDNAFIYILFRAHDINDIRGKLAAVLHPADHGRAGIYMVELRDGISNLFIPGGRSNHSDMPQYFPVRNTGSELLCTDTYHMHTVRIALSL